jgi:hypothetical protein
MEVELSDLSHRERQALQSLQSLESPSQDRPGDLLPPADGGKDAWLFLASSFVIEALVWGKAIH